VIRAGLARALKLLVAVAAGTAAASLLLGLAVGAGADRSLTLGWYLCGSLALVIGFAASLRGPTRATGTTERRMRHRRWATRGEQEESINFSALLVALGVALIVLAVVADRRYPLF
jgi:hypothetical protein